MKKNIYICLLFISLTLNKGIAQEVGTWQTHYSYYNTTNVAETNTAVYAVANNSLYSYDKEDNSIHFYSTQSGLSDSHINQIGFSKEMNTLVVTYTNGNIDLLLLGKNRIKNIPYLKDDQMIQDKTVRDIYFDKEFAYLSTLFGIVVVNLNKEEILDTYQLNAGVYSTVIKDNIIYAATDKGVLQGSLSNNLLDYHNWQPYTLNISQSINQAIRYICFFSDSFTFLADKSVYYQQADGTIRSILKDENIKGMTLQNGKLMPFTETKATIMSSFTDYYTFTNTPVNGLSSSKDPNTIWIAAGNDGLKGVHRSGNSMEIILSDLSINSPINDNNAFMTVHNQKLLVAGGDRWINRENLSGTLMTYENKEWYNFDQATIQKESGIRFSDVTCVAVDPLDANHYFASTWGEGVYEFKDNKYTALYSYKNSTLESVYPNNPSIASNYVRVEGVCFDKNNNLWMTNSSVPIGIKVMKADGKWSQLSGSMYSSLNGVDLIDKILITRNNHKWVNTLRSRSFLFVFDDKGTIDDTSDDVTKIINTFYQTLNGSASSINVSYYYCMAEDKSNGAIWIGTNIGPLICTNPQKAITEPDANMYAYRPTREDADGLLSYLLDGESIRSIAIDGGNRKWLGTETNGLFILSEDGMETIHHFNTDNSPLPSNNIRSLAINQVTGEVFIGTDNGIISYMSGATEGSATYSDVYAYPNPVRPEYDDQVTITGLMNDTNVKITDLNGNLIYQGKSLGGQFTWNCQKKSGERVASGIYLVLAAQPDKGESIVTKIMVIK